MFGATRELLDRILGEVQTLRRSVDAALGKGDKPQMTKAEFIQVIDEKSDTDKLKIDRVRVGRVLSVAFNELKWMSDRERAAMIEELTR